MRRFRGGLLIVVLAVALPARAQFSPGDLSRAHASLDGLDKCSQCHEVGKEISGALCTSCHSEIRAAIAAKHGFHASVASQSCVSCHKEHHGRDAQTMMFDRATFNHTSTGYRLEGKHGALKCVQCHTIRNIREAGVRDLVAKTGRETFLGLGTSCTSCHEDRHKGTVGMECQSCHTPGGWSPPALFNHGKTKFALAGRHTTVACEKCHGGLQKPLAKETPVLFGTKSFGDCTPCHTTPHSPTFSSKTCMSCHAVTGWKAVAGAPFDHDRTDFKLVGKHTLVRCEQCHKPARGGSGRTVFTMKHDKCTDCHADYHAGEFAKQYDNRCEKCHTVHGFLPAIFTLEQHAAGRFALTGAHAATPCAQCHARPVGRKVFRMADISCQACHKDQHHGQFDQFMSTNGCITCHTTSDWRTSVFDHGRTGFPLAGKHATARCEACHQPMVNGKQVVRYKNTPRLCTACHEDRHAGQFNTVSMTPCSNCHDPQGWKETRFNHNTMSSFPLTGGHKNVQCVACHRQERIGLTLVTRYKPLSQQCESCHKEGNTFR